MDQYGTWTHSYKPDFQEEPVPMPNFEDMVDVQDPYTWQAKLESNLAYKAGSTGCLTVLQNGLIHPAYNDSCDVPEGGMCEYRGRLTCQFLVRFHLLFNNLYLQLFSLLYKAWKAVPVSVYIPKLHNQWNPHGYHLYFLLLS